jgi:hypothetical protein
VGGATSVRKRGGGTSIITDVNGAAAKTTTTGVVAIWMDQSSGECKRDGFQLQFNY